MKHREFPVADMQMFDTIKHHPVVPERTDSPLIDRVRELVEALPDHLREIFYLRFVEQKSIRRIAVDLGYNSHWVVQYYIDQIKEVIGERLVETDADNS